MRRRVGGRRWCRRTNDHVQNERKYGKKLHNLQCSPSSQNTNPCPAPLSILLNRVQHGRAMSFDAARTIPHHGTGPSSGMKQISFAAFLLCSALVPVRADLPRPLPFPHPPSRPKPSQLVVSNLSAFPKVKFTIRVGDLPPEPIEEDRTYEFKAATRLFAADAGHKRREWATVEYDGSNAERVQIVVKKSELQQGRDRGRLRHRQDSLALALAQTAPSHHQRCLAGIRALRPGLLWLGPARPARPPPSRARQPFPVAVAIQASGKGRCKRLGIRLLRAQKIPEKFVAAPGLGLYCARLL